MAGRNSPSDFVFRHITGDTKRVAGQDPVFLSELLGFAETLRKQMGLSQVVLFTLSSASTPPSRWLLVKSESQRFDGKRFSGALSPEYAVEALMERQSLIAEKTARTLAPMATIPTAQ